MEFGPLGDAEMIVPMDKLTIQTYSFRLKDIFFFFPSIHLTRLITI